MGADDVADRLGDEVLAVDAVGVGIGLVCLARWPELLEGPGPSDQAAAGPTDQAASGAS